MLGPALESMRPRERLLWLAYAEGYSHREIAGHHGPRRGQHSAAALSCGA
jgi:hypothetical protein